MQVTPEEEAAMMAERVRDQVGVTPDEQARKEHEAKAELNHAIRVMADLVVQGRAFGGQPGAYYRRRKALDALLAARDAWDA